MAVPALLIADDQIDVVEALRLLFKRDGYSTVTTNSPAGVIVCSLWIALAVAR